MQAILDWLIQGSNAKTFVLVMFSITFVGILLYVLTNKKRSERFESYKNIPFDDDVDDNRHRKEVKNEH